MDQAHFSADKPLLIAIDVGIVNVGICVADYTNVIKGLSKIPSFEFLRRSLLETQDEKIYKEYEENIAVELVYNFLRGHWARYFGRAFLVLIEKQMSSPGVHAAKDRACVIIETSLKSFLYSEKANGGPNFYIISPVTWKGEFGLVEKRSIDDKKKTGPRNLNPFRLRHKDASRELFVKLINEQEDPYFKSVLDTYGRATAVFTSDEIEAFFIANYYIRNSDKVWDASILRSHHNAALTAQRTGDQKAAKLRKNKRNIVLEKFSDIKTV